MKPDLFPIIHNKPPSVLRQKMAKSTITIVESRGPLWGLLVGNPLASPLPVTPSPSCASHHLDSSPGHGEGPRLRAGGTDSAQGAGEPPADQAIGGQVEVPRTQATASTYTASGAAHGPAWCEDYRVKLKQQDTSLTFSLGPNF